MQIAVPFTAREQLIPKGCRKPRSIQVAHTHTIVVREIGAEDAPIALVEFPHVDDRDDSDAITNSPKVPREYRWFDARLWVPMAAEHEQLFREFLADPTALGRHYAGYHRQVGDVCAAMDQWSERRTLIDDVPHMQIEEPYFHVEYRETFNSRAVEISVEHASPNADRPAQDRFTILQADTALAYANAMHTALSEHQGYDRTPSAVPATFEVRIAEVVRHTFVPSPRTPTRVRVEMKETVRADMAWGVDYRTSEAQGFRMPDGRRVVPHLAFALLDEETGQTTLLTTAEAEQMGFTVEQNGYRTFWQRRSEA